MDQREATRVAGLVRQASASGSLPLALADLRKAVWTVDDLRHPGCALEMVDIAIDNADVMLGFGPGLRPALVTMTGRQLVQGAGAKPARRIA